MWVTLTHWFLSFQVSVSFEVGEKVLALWPPDGRWYNAVIMEVVSTSGISVKFDDGFTRTLKLHQVSENGVELCNVYMR